MHEIWYFHINSFQSMRAVSNMADFCSHYYYYCCCCNYIGDGVVVVVVVVVAVAEVVLCHLKR
jgi:hypothetical protein